MGHEGREQAASATPILDKILRELPPPKLEHRLSITLGVAEQAKKRLLKKLEKDELTQTDIEHELSSLPDVGGIDESKIDIVDAIRINLHPHNDIKKLPV